MTYLYWPLTNKDIKALAIYLEEFPMNKVHDNLHRPYLLDYSLHCKESQGLPVLYFLVQAS